MTNDAECSAPLWVPKTTDDRQIIQLLELIVQQANELANKEKSET